MQYYFYEDGDQLLLEHSVRHWKRHFTYLKKLSGRLEILEKYDQLLTLFIGQPKNKDHVTGLRLACGLCLGEQESPERSQSLNLGETLEFFLAPEPIWRIYRRMTTRNERAKFFLSFKSLGGSWDFF